MIFKVSSFLTLALALISPGLNAVAAISVPRTVGGVQSNRRNGIAIGNSFIGASISYYTDGGGWQ
jgi:hypothetical protein